MLIYPDINPVLLALGPIFGMTLKVHWYGMMYLFGFMGAFWLARVRSSRIDSPVKTEEVEDLILYGAFGVVLGGRIGYVFFYGFDQLLQDPLWLFRVWDGGMSFHGGLLGVMLAMGLYARKINSTFFQLTDFVAPAVPIGLGFGRIGNFINQELWGRSTDVPWAMIFPNDPFSLPRHPSQLYQFALEGVLLFIILFLFSRKQKPRYAVSALFLLCYGLFRFFVEFFREPDSHIGFDLFGWMTRGQELCLPMMLAGALMLWWAYRSSSQTSIDISTKVLLTEPAPEITESLPVSKPKKRSAKTTTSVVEQKSIKQKPLAQKKGSKPKTTKTKTNAGKKSK